LMGYGRYRLIIQAKTSRINQFRAYLYARATRKRHKWLISLVFWLSRHGCRRG